MKNLKIRTKLLVTFMLIILLFIGTVVVATTGLKQNAAKYLGIIWPEAYTAPSGEQKTGNIIFGTRACMNRTPQPMNIHSNCDTTDDNDMHIYAGVSKIAFNPTLSTSDAASFEVTVYMQPDENGNRFRFGTGDTTQPSVYDPTQQKTVQVTTNPVE